MAFVIEYRRSGMKVGETLWLTPIPPSRAHAYRGLIIHQADTAIILNHEGMEVAVERKPSADA